MVIYGSNNDTVLFIEKRKIEMIDTILQPLEIVSILIFVHTLLSSKNDENSNLMVPIFLYLCHKFIYEWNTREIT